MQKGSWAASTNYLLVLGLAIVVSSPALADGECSILGNPIPRVHSDAVLTARNDFLKRVCGGLHGDIYDLHDPAFKERLKAPHGGRINNVHVYPVKAKRKGLEGKLLLAAVVETDGSIRESAVIESTGYKVLDDAGMKFITNQKYEDPAKLDGQPVRVMFYLPMDFSLKNP